MRRYDPAEHDVAGRYCSRCGKQELTVTAAVCGVCRGSLFVFSAGRSQRQAPRDIRPRAARQARQPAAVVKCAQKESESSEPWMTTALKHLGQIESLAKKHKRYTPRLRNALDMIETELQGVRGSRAA